MIKKDSYKYEELIECANGKLFGPGNAKLPSPPMLMFDRIINIENGKGKFKKGLIEAELDRKRKMWFFDCHFKEDPAMWQLVGFFLGWTGEPGKGRPLGVNSVKFTGEVLKNAKIARYQVDMKRILKKENAVVGLADGKLFSDNKAIYEAEGLKVGLFKS